jgi:hypothetical protein
MLGMRKEVSQMSKKLITACMALAAFAAFAVLPSLASAKPVITHPTGTVLSPAGSPTITATNTGITVMHTSLGDLECNVAWFTGTLTNNSTAGGFEGDITTATFKGTGTKQAAEPDTECTSPFGNAAITPLVSHTEPWCLEGTENNDSFKVRGGSCLAAAKPLEFIITPTIFGSPISCRYTRAATSPVTGTFVTHTEGDAVFTVSNPVFGIAAGQSGFCPGSGELTMSFTGATDNATEEPLFISI